MKDNHTYKPNVSLFPTYHRFCMLQFCWAVYHPMELSSIHYPASIISSWNAGSRLTKIDEIFRKRSLFSSFNFQHFLSFSGWKRWADAQRFRPSKTEQCIVAVMECKWLPVYCSCDECNMADCSVETVQCIWNKNGCQPKVRICKRHTFIA